MDEAHKRGFDIAGWYFRRSLDGSVTVWAESGSEVTFTSERWASIVAAVSHHGEGFDAFRSALRFHVGADEANRSSVNS